MTDYTKLVLSLVVSVAALVPGTLGSVLAYDNADFYHNHATALTAPNLVCGNHLCALGESPHNPQPVVPGREH